MPEAVLAQGGDSPTSAGWVPASRHHPVRSIAVALDIQQGLGDVAHGEGEEANHQKSEERLPNRQGSDRADRAHGSGCGTTTAHPGFGRQHPDEEGEGAPRHQPSAGNQATTRTGGNTPGGALGICFRCNNRSQTICPSAFHGA